MFPTHVGMNRVRRGVEGLYPHVPHTRGDEPSTGFLLMVGQLHVPHTRGDEPAGKKFPCPASHMFPTHVGMNRISWPDTTNCSHVPHTRGDEPPDNSHFSTHAICSPHTWG